jgi:hypothetical protein
MKHQDSIKQQSGSKMVGFLLMVALLMVLAACSKVPALNLDAQATGKWSSVGSSISGAVTSEAFNLSPDLTLLSGQPVVAYSLGKKIVVKTFQANTWQAIGSLRVNASRTALSPTMAASQDALYVTWYETVGTTSNIYVQKRIGTTWTQLGSNLNTDGRLARSPNIALNQQGQPFVVFTQETDRTGPTDFNLLVRTWQNGTWKTLGTSLHVKSNNSFIDSPKIVIDAQGRPVVAWYETSLARGDFAVYIKRWNGSSWQSLDTSNTFYQRRLSDLAIAPNGTLYLATTEDPEEFAPGESEEGTNLYVDRYTTSWAQVGADYLNASGNVALFASLGVDNLNRPVIVYSEYGRAYVKRWLGNGWQNLGSGTGNLYLNKAGSSVDDTALVIDSAGLPYALWQERLNTSSNLYLKKFVP